eukprot:TRINITY_DN23412_c0_g1_i2.p1 TRINITY_DN23412_c0_g1~~TRINITY_DN23412_c0_g1_i2.p1  ORF type:complete len:602 (+),score=107.10 TRINITY_DN23412_c0_g1_i2:117-1922(+)
MASGMALAAAAGQAAPQLQQPLSSRGTRGRSTVLSRQPSVLGPGSQMSSALATPVRQLSPSQSANVIYYGVGSARTSQAPPSPSLRSPRGVHLTGSYTASGVAPRGVLQDFLARNPAQQGQRPQLRATQAMAQSPRPAESAVTSNAACTPIPQRGSSPAAVSSPRPATNSLQGGVTVATVLHSPRQQTNSLPSAVAAPYKRGRQASVQLPARQQSVVIATSTAAVPTRAVSAPPQRLLSIVQMTGAPGAPAPLAPQPLVPPLLRMPQPLPSPRTAQANEVVALRQFMEAERQENASRMALMQQDLDAQKTVVFETAKQLIGLKQARGNIEQMRLEQRISGLESLIKELCPMTRVSVLEKKASALEEDLGKEVESLRKSIDEVHLECVSLAGQMQTQRPLSRASLVGTATEPVSEVSSASAAAQQTSLEALTAAVANLAFLVDTERQARCACVADIYSKLDFRNSTGIAETDPSSVASEGSILEHNRQVQDLSNEVAQLWAIFENHARGVTERVQAIEQSANIQIRDNGAGDAAAGQAMRVSGRTAPGKSSADRGTGSPDRTRTGSLERGKSPLSQAHIDLQDAFQRLQAQAGQLMGCPNDR